MDRDRQPILGVHHVAIAVADAAADHRFHVEVLGLRNVKRTVELRGRRPVQRLFYGNGTGESGTVVATLVDPGSTPGRRGANQVKVVNLAVPIGSIDFWAARLTDHRIDHAPVERLGTRRLLFAHPSGLGYALVATDAEGREPWDGGTLPLEYAIRGLYAPTLSVMDVREMTFFLVDVLGATHTLQDVADGEFQFAAGGPANRIELVHEPYAAPGTWALAPGTAHHVALELRDLPHGTQLHRQLRERGYTDVSEWCDHRYYELLGAHPGALLDFAVPHPEGFLLDESQRTLGGEVKLPDELEDRRERILTQLPALR